MPKGVSLATEKAVPGVVVSASEKDLPVGRVAENRCVLR